jgi:hypothetical protein
VHADGLPHQVRIEGLVGEHSAHNGASATVFEFDEAAQLYGVELGSGDAIPLPVGAAVLPVQSVGVVAGLQASTATHLNGELARVLEHDTETARYLVELGNGKQLRVRRQCVQLAG